MRASCCVVVAIGLWAGAVRAQFTRGSISGTIQDPSGAVAPRVQVTAVHLATNMRREVETNDEGIYLLAALEPGLYMLEFAKPGFEPLKVAEVSVGSGAALVLNETLSPAGTAITINVEAATPELSKASASLSSALDERTIESMPLDFSDRRDVANLMLLAPAVVRITLANGAQLTSTSGQRTGNEMFQVDGADNRDPWFGSRVMRMPPETVSELRVQTNAYSAEYGRSGGGQVSIVTRGGNNKFHGMLWDYYGANWLSAATLTDKVAGVAGARFQQHGAGGSGGGPMRRDRSFFYARVEAQPYREGLRGNNTRMTIPTPDGYAALARLPLGAGQPEANRQAVLDTLAFLPEIYPLVRRFDTFSTVTVNGTPIPMGTTRLPLANPTDQWQSMLRLDHRLSERDSLTYLFQHGRFHAPYAVAFSGLSNTQFGERFASSEEDIYTRQSLSHTRVFSSRWINEFRAAYITPFNTVNAHHESTAQVSIGGAFQFGPNMFTPYQRDGRSWQWQDTSTIQHGRHSLKFGAELERIVTDLVAANSVYGAWTFNNFADFLNDQPNTFTQSFKLSTADPGSLQQSYFAQDDFRLRPDLTINFGLRYQTENVPEGLYGTRDPALLALGQLGPVRRDTNNWAPRLGFAWNPRSGRTVFRGGFGISYVQDAQSALVNGTRNNYPNNVVDSRNQAQIAFLYPVVPAKPARLPAVNPVATFTHVPVDNQDPTVHFYSASVQRQFGARHFLEIGYTGNHSYHLLRYGERNPAVLTEAQAQTVIASRNANSIPAAQQRRLNPAWGSRASRENTAYSNYNAGYVRFDRRAARGLLVGASYTWSAALDSGDSNPQNLRDYAPDYGRAAIDRPQRFAVHYVWQLPAPCHSQPARFLCNGWQAAGYSEWQSGEPFTIRTGVDSNGDGIPAGGNSPDRPNYNPSGRFTLDPVTGDWRSFRIPLDGSGLVVAPAGTNGLLLANTMPYGGNLGRNTFRGPAYTSWNLDLSKSFSLTERMRLLFRASSTNVFNRRNFGAPNAVMNSGSFGQNTPPAVARITILCVKVQF